MMTLKLLNGADIYINCAHVAYVHDYYGYAELGMCGGFIIRVQDDIKYLKGKLGV